MPQQIIVVIELVDYVVFASDLRIVFEPLSLLVAIHLIYLAHYLLDLVRQIGILFCKHLLKLGVLFVFLFGLRYKCTLNKSIHIFSCPSVRCLFSTLSRCIFVLILYYFGFFVQCYDGNAEMFQFNTANSEALRLIGGATSSLGRK